MAEWSDLPFDVLQHLAGFLPLPDYHRFSAVCRNWSIAAKQIRCCSPVKQVPWLLVRGETDPHNRRVFSISENRHYNIAFPELQGRYVCGSSYGWLFTMDIDLNFRLLNPLTGKCYDLPPPPPFCGMANVHVRYVREAPGADEMTYEAGQIVSVYKAITDHDPSQRSDFTVLILYGMYQRRLAFWRPGNLVWTLVEGSYFSFDDIAFFKGNFYANDNIFIGENEVSVTYLVDVGPVPKLTRVAPEVPMYCEARTFLVDFRGELLLLQRWREESEKDRLLTRAFLVFKLDLEEGKYYRCHHLDGYSLFLGTSSPSVADPGQFPGCKRNCIYFTSHNDCNGEEYGRDDNGIYDMDKGTVSPYYPPEIYHSEIVGPIWWTPNPC